MGLDFQAQRIKMVDGQLRTTDVTSHAILDAFLEIPRENFVPVSKQDLAYLDADIAIAPGRYLVEASPFAKLLELAEIVSSDSVLDVGCGSGYSSAILSKVARTVVALEIDADLAAEATENLTALGLSNVTVVTGDLPNGHSKSGPYNVIIVSGSVDQVSDALIDQLRDGGRLVAVEGTGHLGIARLYVKRGKDVSGRFGFNASIKPLPGFAKVAEFAL